MEFMDLSQLGRFVAALVFVLSLMFGLSIAMRRINEKRGSLMKSSKRRLHIVEIMPLDSRRRAVLLRRDDREHLVILGGNGETVIETGIESPQDHPHGSRHD